MAKRASLVVKVGALAFVLVLPLPYAVQLQLLGGVWIIQTLPAVMLALYIRFFNGWALLLGWFAGVGSATWMAAQLGFATAIYPITIGGVTVPCYVALSSLVLNIAVSTVMSLVINALFADQTRLVALADDRDTAH